MEPSDVCWGRSDFHSKYVKPPQHKFPSQYWCISNNKMQNEFKNDLKTYNRKVRRLAQKTMEWSILFFIFKKIIGDTWGRFHKFLPNYLDTAKIPPKCRFDQIVFCIHWHIVWKPIKLFYKIFTSCSQIKWIKFCTFFRMQSQAGSGKFSPLLY